MMNGAATVSIATRSKDYAGSRQEAGKEVMDGPPPLPVSSPLEIEKLIAEPVVRPPSKGVLRRSSYNPNDRAAQNYSIVEDLAQAPSAMSALEFLQSCPSQRKALSAIGGIDPADSSIITFDLENFTPRLPHQIALVIQVGINSINIHRAVVDEGASTCVMSSACWKAIGSQALSSSPNALEAFDGRESKPLGVLESLPITLQGKTINVEVELVNAKLKYNILLDCSWTHAMLCVPSTIF